MSAEISVFKNVEKEAAFMAAYDRAMELWPIPYETTYVSTRFGETHVILSGPEGGDPIVMLHGMTACSATWYANVEALGANHRLYAVDVVGDIGKSRTSVLPQSRQECADWLKELCEGLGITSPHMVGLSYGAFLAINLACYYPDWVGKLVMIAPAAVFDKVSPMFYIQVFSAMILPVKSRVDGMWAWMTHNGRVLDTACGDLVKLATTVGAPKMKVPPAVLTDEELADIETKALLLIGDHEVVCNAPRAIERAKRLVPNLQAELVPDCRHLVPIENPGFVNSRMLDFLAAE